MVKMIHFLSHATLRVCLEASGRHIRLLLRMLKRPKLMNSQITSTNWFSWTFSIPSPYNASCVYCRRRMNWNILKNNWRILKNNREILKNDWKVLNNNWKVLKNNWKALKGVFLSEPFSLRFSLFNRGDKKGRRRPKERLPKRSRKEIWTRLRCIDPYCKNTL